MNRATRGFCGALPLIACISLSLLAPVASAAEGTVSYQHESLQAFQQQLAGGQVSEAMINKRLRSVRVTLKDGRHVLASYAPHEEPRVLAQLKAKHVPVSVLSKSQALQEAKKKPVHHKLRYIAGGIVIAAVVIGAGVLLVNRRRQRD